MGSVRGNCGARRARNFCPAVFRISIARASSKHAAEGFDRVWQFYTVAPELLSFEDRFACDVIEGSAESTDSKLHLNFEPVTHESARRGRIRSNPLYYREMEAQRRQIFLDFVRSMWPRIRTEALRLINEGKGAAHRSLIDLLGMRRAPRIGPVRATPGTRGTYERENLTRRYKKRRLELDATLPWSATARERAKNEL